MGTKAGMAGAGGCSCFQDRGRARVWEDTFPPGAAPQVAVQAGGLQVIRHQGARAGWLWGKHISAWDTGISCT